MSQTSKFMAAYNQLVEALVHPFLPVLGSVVFVCVLLGPRVPLYVVVLMALFAVYALVSYVMYKRILHLNEQAAQAQNDLSGELSDAVTNILTVKTYGREDYERGLFDAANREVVVRDLPAHALVASARRHHGGHCRGYHDGSGGVHIGAATRGSASRPARW